MSDPCLRKGAYRDISHFILKLTPSNKLVSKVSAQKKGGKVMTATNMCSNFGGFRCRLPLGRNKCHLHLHRYFHPRIKA